MASSPSEHIPRSPAKTYAGQGYEVTYFARKHGLTRQQAREIIRKVGHDRDKLNEAAAAMLMA